MEIHISYPPSWTTVAEDFDYVFAENGLTAFKLGKQLPSQSFITFIGEERYKKLANFILHYIADLDIPVKRCVSGCMTGESNLISLSGELSLNSEMG